MMHELAQYPGNLSSVENATRSAEVEQAEHARLYVYALINLSEILRN